ncbi:hypothetical protein [Paraburkholderia fynbosensis]|uniref:Uncharacterized protein n=1 Tax=Paraburkholderia fynbosensis TaxID=1200993 RepID=A0A6J5G4M8_9BURK|nr:hypothetical protein [Paraburkholderia fynbosensis]CAB3791990.1 hypothetical protein LMG27177_03143 [Paraburkholderia fynbosensis]
MNYAASLKHDACKLVAMVIVAGSAALSGCAMNPPGPSQILSRLPPDQSGTVYAPAQLTPEELARYDAIDRQVLFEQDQAIAAENAAQAWSRYYSPPVRVFGGYSSGGWGRGWGTGIGVGFGPTWGW